MTLTIEAPTAPIAAPTKTVADILEHAALIIEERGWIQGRYETKGAVCALGAINVAYGFGPDGERGEGNETPAENALCDFLGKWNGDTPIRAVPDFNDEIGRTADEVTAALRGAAAANR